MKNGTGTIVKNLKASANKNAVNTNLSFSPRKKDSTTFLEDCAPAYLNALYAKTILGITATNAP